MVQFELKNIILQYMVSKGLRSTHGLLDVYMQYGIDAIRELHMDVSGAPSWAMVDIDANTQTVTLPSDCMRLIQVGKLTAKNNVQNLILDNNMVLNDTSSQPFISYVFGNDQNYGASAISGPSYRNDYRTGLLKVSSDVGVNCLYIEYLADIEKIDGKYYVPPYNKEAVLAYLAWASVRFSEEHPLNRIDYRYRQWLKSKDHAENRTQSMTLNEWLETYYKGLTGTITG